MAVVLSSKDWLALRLAISTPIITATPRVIPAIIKMLCQICRWIYLIDIFARVRKGVLDWYFMSAE
jgi:hypothetical protein